MKNKKFYFLLSTSILPISTISCVYSKNQTNYSSLVDHTFDVSNSKVSNEKKTHNSIIEKLLNAVFKQNQARKVEYLESQKNTIEIEKSFNDLKNEINNELSEKNEIQTLINKIPELRQAAQREKEFNNNPQKAEEINKQIKEYLARIKEFNNKAKSFLDKKLQSLINKNWFYFLNNLNNFEFNFIDFLTINLGTKAQEQPESYKKYLENINKLPPYKSFQFKDSLLQSIFVGEETKELGNITIFYIKKDKMVIRLAVENTDSDEPNINVNPFQWYFGSSLNKSISLQLVSRTYHTGFIHQFTSGMEEFAQDMIINQRYKEPGNMYALLNKEIPNEKNS
ncbi:Uncharacterised protein [Mycoplasmopsis maculosa]|uniref:Lipoprotein n=1 Tax=Mycoplasmopsis maculosa TaxID=114885 RepID=A0A449B4U9_9BACT|nr:aromatic motif membrane protein [Mycoplasmopsis maculosa]VEU75631.1 Uncharacterised protein [Mycoplasmopsis maculosa]